MIKNHFISIFFFFLFILIHSANAFKKHISFGHRNRLERRNENNSGLHDLKWQASHDIEEITKDIFTSCYKESMAYTLHVIPGVTDRRSQMKCPSRGGTKDLYTFILIDTSSNHDHRKLYINMFSFFRTLLPKVQAAQ